MSLSMGSLPFASMLLTLLLTACQMGPGPAGEQHPSTAGSDLPRPPNYSIHITDLQRSPTHRVVAPHLRIERVLGTGLTGAEATQFGSIADALVIPQREIWILDSRSRELKRFGTDGVLKQRFGRRGSGPGEFSAPTSLARDSEGDLYVTEGRGRVTRLHVFEDSLHVRGLFTAPMGIADACVLGDTLVLHGTGGGSEMVIHLYDRNGTAIRSFGQIYRRGNPIVRDQLSRGSIACIQGPNLILLAPRMLPELRAYRSSGDLLWWARLEGFSPLQVLETPRGSVMRAPKSKYHLTAAIEPCGDTGRALLQIMAFHGTKPGPMRSAIQTFLVRTDGSGADRVHHDLSRAVACGRDHLLTVTDDPFPQLHHFALSVNQPS